ncbi:MAG: hypothetical protein AAGI01_03335 [Myxococcota bacterium]
MSTHVLANLDFEYALRHAPGAWQRPKTLAALCYRWRAILRLLPGMRHAPLRPLDPSPPANTLCWGPDPRTLEPDQLDLTKRANSKLTSAKLERDLGVGLPHTCVVHDLPELAKRVAAMPFDWVLKHPLGVSARARILGKSSRLDGPAKRWAHKHLASTPLLLEPWVARAQDWSVHADLTDDGVLPAGRTTILTDATGTPRGHLVSPGSEDAALEDAQWAALEALWRWGWRGPVSIDALAGVLGDQHVHRPLVELNARYSFGRMALMLRDHAPPGTHIAWLHPTRKTPAPPGYASWPEVDDHSAQGTLRRLPEWCDPGAASKTYAVVAAGLDALLQSFGDLSLVQPPGS